MKSKSEKISIIVPVYNVEKYLQRCLDSLINQTYKNIEIIAINDGSTDNSLKILRKYETIDSRIKIINKDNEGLSQSRNIGINLATGEYITFVDSDDWIELNFLETMLNLMELNNTDVSLCSYSREYIEKTMNKNLGFKHIEVFNKNDVRNKLYRRMIGPIGDELKNPENLDSLITAWGKVYKTSIIKDNNINFIDTAIIGTEDLLFNVYVFNYVNKAVVINKPLYHYWKGNLSSLTYGYKENLIDKWIKKHSFIKQFLIENKYEEVFFEALNNRICLSVLGLGLNECSNKVSSIKKIRNIKKIINDDHIKVAFSKCDFRKLPIHWRVFHTFNKYRVAIGSYLVLISINILRKLV